MGSCTVTTGRPPVTAAVRSTGTEPLGVSPSGSAWTSAPSFCRVRPDWFAMTLLATSCTRITKLLLPTTLSAVAADAVKVNRAPAPSAPSVPLVAAMPPTVTTPPKSAASAALPVVVVMSW